MKPILFACALTLTALAANAQEVVISSPDGNFRIRGQIIEFTGQKYIIDTSVGRMSIDSANVECTGEACPAIEASISEFSIVGPDTFTNELMAELIPVYAQSLGAQVAMTVVNDSATYTLTNSDNEEIAKIALPNSSSSNSEVSLLPGQSAIALTARPILETGSSAPDAVDVLSIQSSSNAQVVALDAIAIVTAEDNPIDTISTNDAAQVFSGAYTNWSELGGPDAPINLYGPQADSPLARSFIASVIESQGNNLSGLTENIDNVDDVATRVSSDSNGIGYTFFTKSDPAKVLAIKGVCGTATPVNQFTIKAEQYPLTQRLYAFRTDEKVVEHADNLIGFMQSDSGQQILTSHNFVDQQDTSNSIGTQGTRFVNAIHASTTDTSDKQLKDMVAQIINSDRLSTTFRFETGSNQMDPRAQGDIIRLAEKLRLPANRGVEIHLLGFTDSIGNFELNQELSLRRANLVRDALIEFDETLSERVSIQTSGHGEIAPVACNESAIGRAINRRVEVWIDDSGALSVP